MYFEPAVMAGILIGAAAKPLRQYPRVQAIPLKGERVDYFLERLTCAFFSLVQDWKLIDLEVKLKHCATIQHPVAKPKKHIG
jgi:hypothetical protein